MKGLLVSVLILGSASAQALNVELNLRDAEYSQASGLRTVYLRSIMASQRPDIDPRKFTVESVQLTIKSRNGGGTGLLRIGGTPSAGQRIPGLAANWASSGENSFYNVTFSSPVGTGAGVDATWTVDLRNATAKARRALLVLRPRSNTVAPAPRPTPNPAPRPGFGGGGELDRGEYVSNLDGFVYCAEQDENCYFTGTKKVRYGIPGRYVEKTFTTGVRCDFESFQYDPDPEIKKSCYVMNDGSRPGLFGSPSLQGPTPRPASAPAAQPAPRPTPAPAPVSTPRCIMDIQPVEECRQEFVFVAFPGISYWQNVCNRVYREVEFCPR